MINNYSFCHTDVLKLHYLCFFTKITLNRNRKTYFVSQDLNQIKFTSKATKELKAYPYRNYSIFMIEFRLFTSLGQLDFVCFCNEQLGSTNWNYALK